VDANVTFPFKCLATAIFGKYLTTDPGEKYLDLSKALFKDQLPDQYAL